MGIILHREKGVNPRLSVCPRCGEGDSVMLLGNQEHKYTCPSCGVVHYGRPGRLKGTPMRGCQKCGRQYNGQGWTVEPIGDHERPPIMCAKCEAELKEMADIVSAGGAYLKCEDCGVTGVLRPHSELAMAARKQQGIQAPDPIGVAIDRTICPVCNGQPVDYIGDQPSSPAEVIDVQDAKEVPDADTAAGETGV